jgi:hypothetical protein
MGIGKISAEQLKKLQTLYSQFAARSGDARTRTREERLLWASIVCNRDVASFGELTRKEAKKCIDTLQQAGAKAPDSPAQHNGTAEAVPLQGSSEPDTTEPPSEDGEANSGLAMDQERARLGWSVEMFASWLRSPRSPLGNRSQPQIRTVAEANRVRWALMRMLKRRGLWAA